MDYEDRLTITTPEGVELELQLAGLGSRFIAQTLDLIIKGLAIALLSLMLSASGLTGLAIMIPSIALVFYAYDVVFETFSNGRTPGKRVARLRVLRAGGEPVDFTSSAIRNVLRLIEGLSTSYIPGIVSILATKRNQRLGDLAAGTIVVHEEPASRYAPVPGAPGWGQPAAPGAWGQPGVPQPPPPAPVGGVWDVSSVGAEDLSVVRAFLERRWTLEPVARLQLALQLADALWSKVAGAPEGLPPETFLEQLELQKSGRV